MYDQSRSICGSATSVAPSSSLRVCGAWAICASRKPRAPCSRSPACPTSLSTTAPTLVTPVCSGIFHSQPCSYDSMKMLPSLGGSRCAASR